MRISDWSSDVCSSDLWLYGRADARFTVVGYADLECPYCRAYFPALKRWIDAHPEVNWQWHHLPLSMHEPAATAEARLAACAGETGGDRKSVVAGNRVSVRVAPGGTRTNKKKTN